MKADAALTTGAFYSQPRQKLGPLGGELLRRDASWWRTYRRGLDTPPSINRRHSDSRTAPGNIATRRWSDLAGCFYRRFSARPTYGLVLEDRWQMRFFCRANYLGHQYRSGGIVGGRRSCSPWMQLKRKGRAVSVARPIALGSPSAALGGTQHSRQSPGVVQPTDLTTVPIREHKRRQLKRVNPAGAGTQQRHHRVDVDCNSGGPASGRITASNRQTWHNFSNNCGCLLVANPRCLFVTAYQKPPP
jgi:hypothetical protein